MSFKYSACFLSVAVLLIIAMLSVSLGAVQIPLKDIVNILLGGESDPEKEAIILTLRLPRVVEAALVGMGLSVVGAFYQGLFRNPMADPYVLGVSSGAALGATIAIILGLGIFGLGVLSFISALLTIWVVYTISGTGHKVSITTMLLAGIAISAFISAFISLLMLLNHQELANIVFWTMGGFGLATWQEIKISAPVIIFGSLLLYTYSRDLNVIMTGEEAAEHLGVNTEKAKKVILAAGALVTAAAVSVGGIIGFVGLIIPHICRLIVGPDNRVLVPFSAAFGAAFLIIADTLARIALKPIEIPVGIITAVFGGPFFIYLLIKNKKKSESM